MDGEIGPGFTMDLERRIIQGLTLDWQIDLGLTYWSK